MALVPNTNTFGMSDVKTVTGRSNLRDAFTYATASYFDSAYSGSKDRLSNFRNYGAKDTITISPSGVQFNYQGSAVTGGNRTFTVTATKAWTATLSGSRFSASKYSGNAGSTSVTIDYPDYNSSSQMFNESYKATMTGTSISAYFNIGQDDNYN